MKREERREEHQEVRYNRQDGLRQRKEITEKRTESRPERAGKISVR